MTDCFCDYDPPEWVNVRIVKAAHKEHRCEECGRVIRVGESYESTTGKWEGLVNTFKVCRECLALRKWVLTAVPCFCWAYGRLHDDARNTIEDYAPEVPGLAFEFGRKLVAIKRAKKAPTLGLDGGQKDG